MYAVQLALEGNPLWYGYGCVLSTLWFITLINLLGTDVLRILLFFGVVSPIYCGYSEPSSLGTSSPY